MTLMPAEMRIPVKRFGSALGRRSLKRIWRGRGLVHEEKVNQIFIHADEALRGVGDDGRKADDERDDRDRKDSRADPVDDERRNGDDGHRLQQDRVGIEQLAQPTPLREDHGDGDADDDAGEQAAGRFFGGDEQRIQQRRKALTQRIGHGKRAGKNVRRQCD